MMLYLEQPLNIANAFIEPERWTLAARFQRVLALLYFEYELDADVRAEAERVLQRLRARELN